MAGILNSALLSTLSKTSQSVAGEESDIMNLESSAWNSEFKTVEDYLGGRKILDVALFRDRLKYDLLEK